MKLNWSGFWRSCQGRHLKIYYIVFKSWPLTAFWPPVSLWVVYFVYLYHQCLPVWGWTKSHQHPLKKSSLSNNFPWIWLWSHRGVVMVCCLIVTMLLSWQKEASKSCEEIGPLYCPMPDNIWQHKDKSSLRKIRLLCALEEAERRGNRSRPQPSETWSVLSDFAPTADTQYEALCGLGAE